MEFSLSNRKIISWMLIFILILSYLSPFASKVTAVTEIPSEEKQLPEPYLLNDVITEQNSIDIRGIAKNASKVVLKVTTSDGNVVRYEDSVYSDRFTFYIPRQKKGTKIELYSYTTSEVSNSVFFTVEKSFLAQKPFVYPVSPNATSIRGVTTPETTIEIEKDDQIIASGISSETGEFDIPVDPLVEREHIKVYGVNGEKKSQPTTVTVAIPIDQEAPVFSEINLLYNQSTLQGYTEPFTRVQIRINYILVNETITGAGGYFNTSIEAQEDDLVEVTAIDQHNNRSTPVYYTILDWIKPILETDSFSNNQDFFTGKSEPNVTITIHNYRGMVLLASGMPNADGSFALPIGRQVAGTELIIKATDKNGNVTEVWRKVYDVIPPTIESVSRIYEGDTVITGKAEPSSTITLYINDVQQQKAIVYADGTFTMDVPQLTAGDEIKLIATDAASNVSTPYMLTVQKLETPKAPIVHNISDKDLVVTGTADVNLNIKIYKGSSVLAEGLTNDKGEFSIPIPQQIAGTTLTIVAFNERQLASEPTTVVVEDQTAPSAPQVDEVTDQSDSISGPAEPLSTVVVLKGGIVLAQDTANQYGIFNIQIPKQSANTILELFAIDAANNESPRTTIIVKDKTAPIVKINPVTNKSTTFTGTSNEDGTIVVKNGSQIIGSGTMKAGEMFSISIPVQKEKDQLVFYVTDLSGNSDFSYINVIDVIPPKSPQVNKVGDNSTEVTGTAEVGARIFVYNGEMQIGFGFSDGTFKIAITPEKAGTVLTVFAIDSGDNASVASYVTVLDVTPPAKPTVNGVNDKSTTVTGKAEAGATVKVFVGTKQIGSATSNGSYKVTIPAQKAGTVITVKVYDRAGNVSAASTVNVKDVTPPAKPTVNGVNDKSTTVTGKAEAGATVKVFVGTKQLGSAKSTGSYKVVIPVQKAGTVISVKAYDAAGNVSVASNVTVKDVTPPAKPTVNALNDKSTTVTGKAEAGATVKVFAGTKQLGSAKSTSSYKVVIPVQKAGTVISVKAYDAAGNVSAASNVTVKDVTPPAKPTVNVIKNTTTSVTGKAEAKSTVRIYNGTKQIGSGTTNASGNFTIKIPVQKMGVKLTATATDTAGNKSSATTMVVQDGIPPSVPKVNAVYATSIYVSGKAEANSTITIKSGSKTIASGKVDKYGNFKVKIAKQKRGITLTITATDAAKNVSKAASIKVK